MKKTLAALTAAATLTLAPVAVGASTADAAAPAVSADSSAKAKPCVSRAEYRKIKKGMTKTKVHRIFGTAGTRVSKQGRLEARGYQGCPKFSGIGVAYMDGKVASKAAQW